MQESHGGRPRQRRANPDHVTLDDGDSKEPQMELTGLVLDLVDVETANPALHSMMTGSLADHNPYMPATHCWHKSIA